jgi:transposase InsO family protein
MVTDRVRVRVMSSHWSRVSSRSLQRVCTTAIDGCTCCCGGTDNHKRLYRLYRNEGLSLRHKRPRRNKAARLRQPQQLVHSINEIWSMDFVADALFDGRRLRAFTIVDNYTRECLAIEVGQRLTGDDVAATLNRIKAVRGLPQTIKVDNGSEFISKVMDRWAYEHRVELDFSRPGRPIDNAKIESFNGRPPRRVSGCALVLVTGRCAAQDRGVARLL